MRLRARLALMLFAVAIPLSAGAVWLRADLGRRAAVSNLLEFARARMNSGGREACEAAPTIFQEPPLRERPGGGPLPGRGGPGRDRRGPERAGRPGPDFFGPPQARDDDRRGPGGPLDPRGPGGPGRNSAMTPAIRLELFAYGVDFKSANPRAPEFPATMRADLESGAIEASDIASEGERRTVSVAARMDWAEGPCALVLVRRFEPRPPWTAWSDAWTIGSLVLVLMSAVLLAVGPIVRRVRALDQGVRRSAALRYAELVPVQGRDEIAELAVAFNAAGGDVRAQIDEIEKRERSLRDFVENTTHDVMLPLTVLQGHLTRLRNEIARGVVPDREVVRDALEESHYMASLVQNLGAAAKLEAGEPELRRDPFSWNQIVERVVMRHKTIASEKGVELDYAVPEEDVRAAGDVTLVEQALSNVVHNAVRYNKRGGHVAILLELHAAAASADSTPRAACFVVRVFDDGPGVPDSELARLAERSYRSDAARARYPDGKGLGLSIAKDVADRLGFELALKRSSAGGLDVEFRGPLIHGEAQRALGERRDDERASGAA